MYWLSRLQYRSKQVIPYSLSILKLLYSMELLYIHSIQMTTISKAINWQKICEYLDSNVFVHRI